MVAPQSLISATRGSTERTPNGNVGVVWGQNPMYTEYGPDGELVMNVQRGRVRDIEHGIVGVTIESGRGIGRATQAGVPTLHAILTIRVAQSMSLGTGPPSLTSGLW